MTYIVGGLIQATDYNLFAATATPNVNQTWAIGSGNAGYGQTALDIVDPADIVFATDWASLCTAIQTSADHQGITLDPLINPTPVPGDVIAIEPVLSNNISSIYATRLNAIFQGSTSATVATSLTTWGESMTMTFTVSFDDHNCARYFFNAGGQLGLSFYHPASDTLNTVFSNLASSFGTIWLSSPVTGSISLSGVAYQGVTQFGGTLSGLTINSNLGFYALNTNNQELAIKYATGSTSPDSYIKISAQNNGAGVITLTALWDNVPNAFYYSIASGSTGTLTVRPPSTSFLSDSWGTPIVSTSIIVIT